MGILIVPAPPPALNLKQDKRFAMAANSTVMYSGLDPCAKSSSKVLAPPGGKSSIGFGPEEDLRPSAPAEPNPESRPEVDEETTEQVVPKTEEPKDEVPEQPEKPVVVEEKKEAETETYTKAMGPQGPMVEAGGKGGRKVPPGGFSSGA